MAVWDTEEGWGDSVAVSAIWSAAHLRESTAEGGEGQHHEFKAAQLLIIIATTFTQTATLLIMHE